jgi:hypothetical protein
VREHLGAVDLEAIAELNVGALDDLLQLRLALEQRQFSQVLSVEIEQVECDHDDLGGIPLQLVLQYGEIGGVVGRWRDDLSR